MENLSQYYMIVIVILFIGVILLLIIAFVLLYKQRSAYKSAINEVYSRSSNVVVEESQQEDVIENQENIVSTPSVLEESNFMIVTVVKYNGDVKYIPQVKVEGSWYGIWYDGDIAFNTPAEKTEVHNKARARRAIDLCKKGGSKVYKTTSEFVN